jgi:uncharacterized protein YecE (DUF72 family)
VILIGTSGFDYDDWRGPFYPRDLPKQQFLGFYARRFRALELNFSYYRMPAARQLATMVERTQGAVTFSIKAHRSMTHERTATDADVAAFREALAPLRESGTLGAVLLQFPQSFHQREENRVYLARLAESVGPPLAVELRRAEWAQPMVIDWLARLRMGYCCVDEPDLPNLMPRAAAIAGGPGYVRFHGRNAAKWHAHDRPEERYDYRYSSAELEEWVPKVKRIEAAAGKVLVFFNNHPQAQAVDAARAFEGMVAS